MTWLKMLFSDGVDPSMMRVMGFTSMVFAFGIAIVGVLMDKNLSHVSILCGVFIGPAFAGKVLQRNIEMKEGRNDQTK